MTYTEEILPKIKAGDVVTVQTVSGYTITGPVQGGIKNLLMFDTTWVLRNDFGDLGGDFEKITAWTPATPDRNVTIRVSDLFDNPEDMQIYAAFLKKEYGLLRSSQILQDIANAWEANG